MGITDITNYLEEKYNITKDARELLSPFSLEGEDGEKMWFEKILLDCYKESLFENWNEHVKEDARCYLENRLSQSSNEHLLFKYRLNLFYLTGDFTMMRDVIDRGVRLLQECLSHDEGDEWYHSYCDLFKVLYPLSLKCRRNREMVEAITFVLNNCSCQFQFNILMMVYWQEQKETGEENNKKQLKLGKNIGNLLLTEKAIKLSELQDKDVLVEKCLEAAVFFSKHCAKKFLRRKANEMLGDYLFSRLWPDDPKNLAIAWMNNYRLRTVLSLYQESGNTVKQKQVTVEFQKNKRKLIFLRIGTNELPDVAKKREYIIDSYVKDVLSRGERSLWGNLIGYGLNVFVGTYKDLIKMSHTHDGSLYTQFMRPVISDGNRNSRSTTHEQNDLRMIMNYSYRTFSYHIFQNLIFEGLKNKTLDYDNLKDNLLDMGFNLSVVKYLPDGGQITASIWDSVDLGILDFLEQNRKFMNNENPDWRICTTILTTQFEGLIRSLILQLDGVIDKQGKSEGTERMLLEDLLNNAALNEIFDEDDIFLFKMVFTNNGYNIRNEVAHAFFMPQEYTASKALLVFLCVMRIAKGTLRIVTRDGGLEENQINSYIQK